MSEKRDEQLATLHQLKTEATNALQREVDAGVAYRRATRAHQRAVAEYVATVPHFESSGNSEFEARINKGFIEQNAAVIEAVDKADTEQLQATKNTERIHMEINTLIAEMPHIWVMGFES